MVFLQSLTKADLAEQLYPISLEMLEKKLLVPTHIDQGFYHEIE